MMLKNDARYLFLQATVEILDYIHSYVPVNADLFQSYMITYMDLGKDVMDKYSLIFHSVMSQAKLTLRYQIQAVTTQLDSCTIYADVFSSIYRLLETAKLGDVEAIDELSSRVLQAYELIEYIESESAVDVLTMYLDGVENTIHGLLQEVIE